MKNDDDSSNGGAQRPHLRGVPLPHIPEFIKREPGFRGIKNNAHANFIERRNRFLVKVRKAGAMAPEVQSFFEEHGYYMTTGAISIATNKTIRAERERRFPLPPEETLAIVLADAPTERPPVGTPYDPVTRLPDSAWSRWIKTVRNPWLKRAIASGVSFEQMQLTFCDIDYDLSEGIVDRLRRKMDQFTPKRDKVVQHVEDDDVEPRTPTRSHSAPAETTSPLPSSSIARELMMLRAALPATFTLAMEDVSGEPMPTTGLSPLPIQEEQEAMWQRRINSAAKRIVRVSYNGATPEDVETWKKFYESQVVSKYSNADIEGWKAKAEMYDKMMALAIGN